MLNIFHKSWNWKPICSSKYDSSNVTYAINANFNIIKKFMIGLKIDISYFAMDWSLSFLIFNFNGHWIFNKKEFLKPSL